MTGSIFVKIHDSRNSYSFELKRNITVLCGDSGRGKTTLFDMVEDYNRYGASSATKLSCDVNVIAVRGRDWQSQINKCENSVIVIDEDSEFIRSQAFAETVKNSSNYFLLITRCYLPQLPISVTELYELVGRKNKKFKRIYTHKDSMYDAAVLRVFPFRPDIIITEDAGAGYQFFRTIADRIGAECVSANGKSNVFTEVYRHADKNVLVIADGAAFGAEIQQLVSLQELRPKKIGIFLPESFEWLILKSGLVCNPEWDSISIDKTLVDSKKFFSWEQYFTSLLVDITKGEKYQRYPKTKNKLPKFYTQEKSIQQVENIMAGVDFSIYTP